MLRILPDFELLQHSAARPIILAGRPDALTGDVYLANPGDEHIVVKSARLRGVPNADSGEIDVAMPAILRAWQQSRTKVIARLSPMTPPGVYQTTLALGEFTYPAELHVIEDIDLDIVPDQLILEVQPGTRVQKQVVFRNGGNVALTIGSPEALVIDEELMSCRIVRGGLAEGREHHASNLDEWVTAFMNAAYGNVREAGMLYVRNTEGETSVQPGESRAVEFVIRQPDTLRPGRRYISLAFFYMANLLISIVPGKPPSRPAGDTTREELTDLAEPKEPGPPRRKPRKPRSGT